MGETYHNSFDALIQKIRQDPVIYEHRDESGFKMPFDFSETEKPNDIDIFRKSKKWKTPKFSRALTEDQYFSEDENITVLFPDGIQIRYPLRPNFLKTPIKSSFMALIPTSFLKLCISTPENFLSIFRTMNTICMQVISGSTTCRLSTASAC